MCTSEWLGDAIDKVLWFALSESGDILELCKVRENLREDRRFEWGARGIPALRKQVKADSLY